MPACGEGNDKPLQQRLGRHCNLFIVVAAIDIECRRQQGLKSQGPAEEVPLLNRLVCRCHSWRQASNGGSECCREECQDCDVKDELPHQSGANHAEDGEMHIQMHQFGDQHKVEEHGEGSKAVVGMNETTLPFPILTTIGEKLTADREAVEHRFAAQPQRFTVCIIVTSPLSYSGLYSMSYTMLCAMCRTLAY